MEESRMKKTREERRAKIGEFIQEEKNQYDTPETHHSAANRQVSNTG